MLQPSSVARLAAFVALGDGEGLARYLGSVLDRSGDLAPVRETLGTFTPEFRALALDLAPWLASDRLAHPDRVDPAERILEVLGKAGREGMKLSELTKRVGGDRDAAITALVLSGRVVKSWERNGGRPAAVYRLAEHAAGIIPADHGDPFAFRPAPIL